MDNKKTTTSQKSKDGTVFRYFTTMNCYRGYDDMDTLSTTQGVLKDFFWKYNVDVGVCMCVVGRQSACK